MKQDCFKRGGFKGVIAVHAVSIKFFQLLRFHLFTLVFQATSVYAHDIRYKSMRGT